MKKNLYLILPLLFFVLIISCTKIPDNFTLPEWDIDLKVPITERSYKLSEIINTGSQVTIDSALGNYYYKITSDEYGQSYSTSDFIKNQLNIKFDNNELPVIDKDTSIAIIMSSGALLDSAILSGGTLTIKIKNNNTSSLDYSITPLGMLNTQKVQFSKGGTVAAGAEITETQDLNGFTYTSSGNIDKSKLIINLHIKGQFTGKTAIISLDIENTNLHYVEGILKAKKIDPISKSMALPLPNDVLSFRDKLTLNDVKLFLKADYISNYTRFFEVLLQNVQLKGKRKSGQEFFLRDQNGNTTLNDILVQNGLYSKEFNGSNSNIADFLSFMPDSMLLISDVILNPSNKAGVSTDRDSIRMRVSFQVGSSIVLKETTRADTLDLQIDGGVRDQMQKCRNVVMNYDVNCAIPLLTQVTATYLDSLYKPYFSQNIKINGANYISNSSDVQPVETKAAVTLDSTQIYSLSKSKKLILNWSVQSTNGTKPVIYSPNQWVKIKAKCAVKYHFDN